MIVPRFRIILYVITNPSGSHGARHVGAEGAIRGHALWPRAVTPGTWDVAARLSTILSSTTKSLPKRFGSVIRIANHGFRRFTEG